jgi:uncharacterized repeat protein (TIGR03803 family)
MRIRNWNENKLDLGSVLPPESAKRLSRRTRLLFNSGSKMAGYENQGRRFCNLISVTTAPLQMRSGGGRYGNGYNKQLYVEGLMQRRNRIFGKLASIALALAPAMNLAQAAWAQTYTTLLSFDNQGGPENPYAGLIQATNGEFYGTAGGGASDNGTIFRITPSGALTPLYSFCPQSGCLDGGGPNGLVQATNGEFYGTASQHGTYGFGTIFKIAPDGTPTTLYSFNGYSEGGSPQAALVQASNGDLYGTAYQGGQYCGLGPTGCGTLFKITPGGSPPNFTTLDNFCTNAGCGPLQGGLPASGLVQAANDDLYGTTSGIWSGYNFAATIFFSVTPSGTAKTLYTFGSQTGDGYDSLGALVQGADGSFYGTTYYGGAYGYGTVFKITADGAPTTLYSFCKLSGCTDGAYPRGALIQATDGNLYGTTSQGGTGNCTYPYTGCGTVFSISPKGGTPTILHSFAGYPTDGEVPYAGLVQATNGDFYGTTYSGGSNDRGTVFSLSAGLGPFVKTQTTSGKVGAAVKILGTDLNGATSVTFSGTTAVFEVQSRSLITTTVPAGATTGKVKVTTPLGTLTSNVPFRVRP